MDSEPSPHQLSASENERIFREHIVPGTLNQATPQAHPLVVFLGGQTGAGKTAVAQMIKDGLSRRGEYTNINMDYYNPHHPRFALWQAEDETTASLKVRPDGDIWWQKAQEYAISRRSDVVLETAMLGPSEYAEPARLFRSGDYQVETAFLAVPSALSRLGILSRLQGEVEAYGHGRYIDPAVHDASYDGVLQAAATLDREGLSDNVFVFRRDGSTVHRNHRSTEGDWQEPPSTVEAIQNERNRPWTRSEGLRFLAQAQQLEGRLAPGLQDELKDIRGLAVPLLPADLQQDTRTLPAPAQSRLGAAARLAATGRDRDELLQDYRNRQAKPDATESPSRVTPAARKQLTQKPDGSRRREDETRRGPDRGNGPRL